MALILLSFLLCQPVLATEWSGRDVMNDIRFQNFQQFERDWKLVTIRYRKDTQEMRWTYANDKAWETLSAGSIDFPDGAVFGKIGVRTHEDPQFPSSVVPSGARRYQFMVRDQKKYAETGGWGYALFDAKGKTFPEEPRTSAIACYACHQIASNRGQVFSQPFHLANYARPFEISVSSGAGKTQTVEFTWLDAKRLPAAVRDYLAKDVKRVRTVTNSSLRQNLFQGTLDEIRPVLEIESRSHRTAAILLSQDERRFSFVTPVKRPGCPAGRSFLAVSTLLGKEPKLQKLEYCNP